MSDLHNKKILITGATSGIGRACANALLAAGADIVALGRGEAALAELGIGPTRTYIIDVSDEAGLKALMPRLKADVGPVDGCLLAAGIHSFRPFAIESPQDLQRMWAVNVQGCLGLVAQLLKGRLIAKGASLVFFSSAAAHKAGAGAVSYAASKGAIESAMRGLALELASQRIRVNAISAGVVRTPMSEAFLRKLTSQQLAALEASHPMGFGSPEDVAAPVLFLLSDQARWITGAVLPVDGGYAVA